MECSVCGKEGDIVYSVHSADGTALKRYCLKCAGERVAYLEAQNKGK